MKSDLLPGRTFTFGAAVVLSSLSIAISPAQDHVSPEARPWGAKVFNQALSITTDKQTYEAGERIVLDVRFKNFGSAGVWVVSGFGPAANEKYNVVIVESPHMPGVGEHGIPFVPPGGVVPLTLYGRREFDTSGGSSGGSGTFRPGREKSHTLDLTRLFDMSLDGKYRIWVSRYVWGIPRTEPPKKATSNTIELTVKDAPFVGPAVRKLPER
jgi:hypothetical protein